MRELTLEELELVSGGNDTNVIVVVGDGSGDDWGDYWWDNGDWYDPGDYGDGGGGGGGDEPPPPDNEYPCENSAATSVANDIATADANDGRSGNDQPEYGATIAESGGNFYTSDLVTGQSYAENNPPGTSISPPDGYGWGDVVATVHSHPPSGDGPTDIRNQAPSDGDWDAADRMVAAGVDASTLTIYIIDSSGTMRAFDYMTPSERGATSSNPSGTQTSGSDGTVVDTSGSGGCGGSSSGTTGSTGGTTTGGTTGGGGGTYTGGGYTGPGTYIP